MFLQRVLAEDNRQTSKCEIPTWKSILLQELLFGEDFHSLEEEEKAVLKLNKSQRADCCDLEYAGHQGMSQGCCSPERRVLVSGGHTRQTLTQAFLKALLTIWSIHLSLSSNGQRKRSQISAFGAEA